MYTACGAAGDGAELTLISNVVSVLVTATSLQPSKLQRSQGGVLRKLFESGTDVQRVAFMCMHMCMHMCMCMHMFMCSMCCYLPSTYVHLHMHMLMSCAGA